MRDAVRLGLILVVVGVAGFAVRAERRAVSADLSRPRDLHGTSYVGSVACRRCHQDHYQTWSRTFHRRMTAEATPASVEGDFAGAVLTSAGVTARMDRDAAGGYRMTFTRRGRPPRVAEIARTVGSRRYQQYLAREGDSYWRLPVAWNVDERRWFPMTSAFLFADPTEDEPTPSPSHPVYGGGDFDRHVTRWNDNCVFCHNVDPNPGRDPATGAFRTTVAELGVACEACHGPGGEHAARNADPARRYALYLGGAADPTIVNPSRLSPERAADFCGRCHGQRLAADVAPFLEHGDPFVPGDDLAEDSEPLWRDTSLGGNRQAFAPRFWSDGTARLTAYEYQGLLQSPCAMRGPLTCTSCHGMHEGDPRGQIRERFAGAASDRMCTGCHQALAAPAALGAHAHHDPASEGGRCVGCHMPRIVYGVLDVHRSHRIEVPDPARAAAAGRPDACTNCHADRTVDWASAAAQRWWPGARAPDPAGARAPDPAGARTAPSAAVFAGDPVARAIAADALGRAPPPTGSEDYARRVASLLDVLEHDRYPAVRQLGWRSLRRLVNPGAPLWAWPGAGYDPAAPGPARAVAVARLRAGLGPALAFPTARTPSDPSQDQDLEIGE